MQNLTHSCASFRRTASRAFAIRLRVRANVGCGELLPIGVDGLTEGELADSLDGIAGGAATLDGFDVLLHPVLGDGEKFCLRLDQFPLPPAYMRT